MFNKSNIVNIKGNDYLVLKIGSNIVFQKSAKENLKQLESVGFAGIIEFKGEKYIRVFEPQGPNKTFSFLK